MDNNWRASVKKKRIATFADKTIFLLILLLALLFVLGIVSMNLLFKYSHMEWQEKSFIVVVMGIIIISICILIKKWVLIPYKSYTKLFNKFIHGQVYQEVLDTAPQFFPGMDGMLLRFDKLLNKNKMIQLSTKQAELLALQNQINPHFLYNTLDAIRGDALCVGMDNIADITEALSTFFRYTITETGSLVTIMSELENVDNYFKIQQYRFGEKLKIEIEIKDKEEDVLQLQCPKLMIQPLVENAILHGLEKRAEGGKVHIVVEKSDRRVLINIRDNGVGIDRKTLEIINKKLEHVSVGYIEDEKKGGIALNNVSRRIKLLFGEEYGIHVYSLVGMGTNVSVILPIVKRNEKQK
jgi:two-component system, sensor histidine kinase YesM